GYRRGATGRGGGAGDLPGAGNHRCHRRVAPTPGWAAGDHRRGAAGVPAEVPGDAVGGRAEVGRGPEGVRGTALRDGGTGPQDAEGQVRVRMVMPSPARLVTQRRPSWPRAAVRI